MSASAATQVKRCLRANPGAIPTPAPVGDPERSRRTPDFERHRRKCAVCNHPEREAIEELFIYWHSAGSITDHFDLPDWSPSIATPAPPAYTSAAGTTSALCSIISSKAWKASRPRR